MALTPGDRIGPYEIVGLIGAGGMGEVYRARDGRLNRDVALKVLPELFAADPERVARFKREAQVLASLNHPHIAAIYGFEENALVLELVDGPTLADRIAQGPIPLDEAIPIARQIADALDAAHGHGVIHRDLKPANIKVRPDGTVKVLDFGLARAFEGDAAASGMLATMSPTITSPAATRIGMILGTAAYMSPEQARGKQVDKRSDVWAFGCVVYEMLTGRRAFEGEDVTDTIASVMRQDIAWGALPSETPAAVRTALMRCLQRDPRERVHDIADARLALDGAFDSRDTTVAPPSPRRRPPLGLLGITALVTAIATGLVVWVITRPSADVPARQMRFEFRPPDGGIRADSGFALSPDGSHLAFLGPDAGGRSLLWLHSFSTGQSRPVSREISVVNVPIWSPDSRQLAFYADGKLRRIDIASDLVQTIGDADGTSLGSWNRNGVILYGRSTGAVMRVDAAGGPSAPVTAVDTARQERGHTGPQFLPDGRHFLYARLSTMPEKSGVFVGSLDATPEDQDSRMLVATPWSPGYAPTADPRVGYLFFVRDRTLFAQAFDNDALTLMGDATPLAEQIGDNANATALFSVSASGMLTYRQTAEADGGLLWVDRSGRETGTLGPERLKRPEFPRLSPDGRRVALTIDRDVWVYDVAGRPPIKLTFDGTHYSPLWTRDGTRLVYEAVTPSPLLSVASDGSGGAPQPVSPSGHYHPHGWSADGRWLVAVSLDGANTTIVKVEAGNPGQAQPVVQTVVQAAEGQRGAAVSPDGRWLAYVSNVTGQDEIWVQPFPGPGAPMRVSPAGGVEPVWSRNGRELYYLQGMQMMAVALDTAAGFSFTPPTTLFTSRYLRTGQPPSYDVAADGRFLMIKSADSSGVTTPITVVVNWIEALTSTAPVH